MKIDDRTNRRRATAALGAALVAVFALFGAAVTSAPAGAAPQTITGEAAVALGFDGMELAVPERSTFTGSIDTDAGTLSATVASTNMDLSFPLGDDLVGFSGTFSNPGGFTGTVSGTEVQLTGTARFKLTGVNIPGMEVPPLLGLLPCNFDFKPVLVGNYDELAGVIDGSDDEIVVPTLPALCASAIDIALGQSGVDLTINDLIRELPPASATMTLTFDEPLVTTTTTTSTTTTVPVSTATRLSVLTDPPVASTITVDGLIADEWGVHGLAVTPGVAHEVCFGAVAGFTAPDCQLVTVPEGQTRTVTGSFVSTPQTWLSVKTDPPVNAVLTVDGAPANNWGLHGLPVTPGVHEVCFGAVAGFTAPDCETIEVTAGTSRVVTGSYTPDPAAPGAQGLGQLRVETSPAVASLISIDGVPADTWGLDWLQIAPGVHEVCFGAVAGFTAPDCETVEVTAGEVSTVLGAFTAHGNLDITTDPGGDVEITVTAAGTPIARGNWSMYIAVPPGDYEVCFGDGETVVDPVGGCVTVTVDPGATTPVTGRSTD